MKDKIISWGIWLSIIGIVFYAPIADSLNPRSEPIEVEPICRTESISFEETEEESEDYALGTSLVSQEGVEGERKICELDGIEESNEVTVEPVTQITTVGIYEEEYEEPVYTYRVGAWCWDGTWSNATGSGACSWHGGVSEWAYE